jgi:hypothetical protein
MLLSLKQLLLQLQQQMKHQRLQLLQFQFLQVNLLKVLIHPNFLVESSNITILPKKQSKLKNKEWVILHNNKSSLLF